MKSASRDWSREEIEELRRLWEGGTLLENIAQRLDRSMSDVTGKATEIGLMIYGEME
jgi:hypothetical protein